MMIQAELIHQQIKVNGVKLHVVFCGPEDGPKVILLHGFPEFWYGWRHQIDPLVQAGYRLIIPDQRGYNQSEKPNGVRSYGLKHLSQDIIALMDHCQVERCFVVGHDWGALVAWWLALQHPHRVQKMVVMNVPHPVVMQRYLRSNLRQIRKSWYVFLFQLPYVAEWLITRQRGVPMSQKICKTGREDSFSLTDLEEYRTAWLIPGAARAMINWYRAIVWAKPPTPKDPIIQTPTLLIWGKQDIALGYEMAQPSIDLCAIGELKVIEDATHWVQHDASAQVNEYLLEWLV